MIDADRLVKHFRSGDGGIVRAVDDVSFTVAGGEMVGLLGANGVGKTTTMRMLATLLKPTSGTARIAGHDIVREPLAVRPARLSLGHDRGARPADAPGGARLVRQASRTRRADDRRPRRRPAPLPRPRVLRDAALWPALDRAAAAGLAGSGPDP